MKNKALFDKYNILPEMGTMGAFVNNDTGWLLDYRDTLKEYCEKLPEGTEKLPFLYRCKLWLIGNTFLKITVLVAATLFVYFLCAQLLHII